MESLIIYPKSHGKVGNLPENQLKNSGMIWSNRKSCRKFANGSVRKQATPEYKLSPGVL